MNFQGNMTADQREGFPKTGPRDAATEGIHLPDERMHLLSHIPCFGDILFRFDIQLVSLLHTHSG